MALPLPITPSHAESRSVRAGKDGHGVHGGSRGVCRRRVRGDVLTYQGTGLRPAGEAPPIPKGGREGKENRFDGITFCPEVTFRGKDRTPVIF